MSGFRMPTGLMSSNQEVFVISARHHDSTQNGRRERTQNGRRERTHNGRRERTHNGRREWTHNGRRERTHNGRRELTMADVNGPKMATGATARDQTFYDQLKLQLRDSDRSGISVGS
uniref:S-antigen protein-like isoform X2 n=1 Tax=Oncorhynchus gorbuscha TaxID=8017 RepID=UPI001EAF12E9|nr:S-antigen protein-like isoform X2 [Oncorhynchus gorbuscha]XP_046193396.1 S-antigen protein-like isoform X2 [Oncorhynchus gorbuscha]